MTEKYDIAILGLGGMGSATLYNLGKRGLKVCGIEQFGLAHDRGSSHGETRMIRKAYFEHPDYIPLLERAYQLWHEFEEERGEQLFVKNGLIIAGPPDCEVIRGLDLCYAKYPLPHEKLTGREARSRFPQFNFENDLIVYVDPVAGFLYVEKCVAQFIKRALDLGAAAYFNERVFEWRLEKNRVLLKTNRREIAAEKLIITAGAWAKLQLQSLGIPLQILRKVLFWYDFPQISNFKPGAFPTFYVQLENAGFYGFPAINELGLKVGEHQSLDEQENPDKINRNLQPDDEPPILSFLNKMFPGLQPVRQKFSICMYTLTPDHHFILDHHPGFERVIIGAGFSGHGFKFAPVVGEILADLAVEGRTTLQIDFLKLDRLNCNPE